MGLMDTALPAAKKTYVPNLEVVDSVDVDYDDICKFSIGIGMCMSYHIDSLVQRVEQLIIKQRGNIRRGNLK